MTTLSKANNMINESKEIKQISNFGAFKENIWQNFIVNQTNKWKKKIHKKSPLKKQKIFFTILELSDFCCLSYFLSSNPFLNKSNLSPSRSQGQTDIVGVTELENGRNGYSGCSTRNERDQPYLHHSRRGQADEDQGGKRSQNS